MAHRVRRTNRRARPDRIRSVAFSPDGTCIVSGSEDYTLRIWDVLSGTPIGSPLQGHSRSVRSVAYSPSGTRIVSGSADQTVRIWDAASGALIGDPLRGHSHDVMSVSTSPDGTHIASASTDNTIRTWDASPAAVVSMSRRSDSAVVSIDAPNICNVDVTDSSPVFSNGSMLHEDGWMTTSDGQLLFWVPPEFQTLA
jgi:WD40 repeat protein